MDPTDRSIFRDTMIRTMPVAMIAVPDAWTASVTMFAGRRNVPPDTMWKPTRMTASATSMPNRRRSISVFASVSRTDPRGAGCA